MVSFSFLLVSCSAVQKVTQGLKEFNESAPKNDAGYPAKLGIIKRDYRLLVHHKWLPDKRHECNLLTAEDLNYDMVETVYVDIYIEEGTDSEMYRKMNRKKLKRELHDLACQFGANGYTDRKDSDDRIQVTLWSYKKNMKVPYD